VGDDFFAGGDFCAGDGLSLENLVGLAGDAVFVVAAGFFVGLEAGFGFVFFGPRS